MASGGSFAIDVLMMGGDNYTIDNANGTTSNLGYVSSNGSNLKTFVRYGENALYTHNGMVEFINLCPLDINEIPIDYPVYQIKVTPINTTDTQYVYLYHTTETEAKAIASKIDANYQNAIYVPVEFSSHLENGLIFDLSAYFDAGIYKADIRTLAGIGNGEDEYKHYLLNAKFPATEFTFQKLTDAKFTSSQGFLVFDLSYINQDGQKIYCTDYEITLVDGTTATYKHKKDPIIVETDDIVTYTNDAVMELVEKQTSYTGIVKDFTKELSEEKISRAQAMEIIDKEIRS